MSNSFCKFVPLLGRINVSLAVTEHHAGSFVILNRLRAAVSSPKQLCCVSVSELGISNADGLCYNDIGLCDTLSVTSSTAIPINSS